VVLFDTAASGANIRTWRRPGGCTLAAARASERRFRGLVFGRNPIPCLNPVARVAGVYLVLNDFGRYGRAYSETSEERADLETTITDLITGQYDRPVRVVAFNTAEGWSADVLRARSCAALILPAMNCPQRSKASSISTLARIVSSPCGWHSPNYLGDIYSSGCPLCLRLRAQLGYRARSEKCQ
jgi:hypothetical protein